MSRELVIAGIICGGSFWDGTETISNFVLAGPSAGGAGSFLATDASLFIGCGFVAAFSFSLTGAGFSLFATTTSGFAGSFFETFCSSFAGLSSVLNDFDAATVA